MKEILEFKILEYGNHGLTVFNLTMVLAIFIGCWLLLKAIRKIIYSSNKIDQGRKFAIYQIIKYVVLIITVTYSFEAVGINITLILAGSAALLVGLGLGLQDIFKDFVSGIVILLDGSIKVNDIIEVNKVVSRVLKIGIRTSTVYTRDEISIIIPNSYLTSNELINWTHGGLRSRFDVKVGVAYGTDIEKASELILAAALSQDFVVKVPEPSIRLIDFGNSSVDLQLLFWTDEVFWVERIRSGIRKKIYKSFNENDITIPFPQRTVHIKND